MNPIPLNLLTLYADLRQGLEHQPVGSEHQPATVSRRLVGGKRRIYLRTRDGSQLYVGTAGDPQAEAKAAAAKRASTAGKARRRVITALKAAGVPAPDATTGRVIAAFASAGLFERGAVLVGTTAFQIYPLLVASYLSSGALRTQDADIALTRVAVHHMAGVPSMHSILKRADPSFEPRLHRDHKYPFTFRSDLDFVVDVLTSQGRLDGAVLVKGLDCGAQPLKYLDYLIEDPIRAVALVGTGVLVKVPQPGRFALHKLIVAQQRSPTNPKVPKDLAQARELIEALDRRDPGIMQDELESVMGRGPAWRKLIRAGFKLAGLPPP